jgi:hypothetical protein
MSEQEEEINETAFYIAGHLGETEKQAMTHIHRVTKILGPDQALAYLKKAKEVEAAGGMMLPDGKRRTLGGVYFQLIKKECEKTQVERIWPPKPRWRNSPPKKQEVAEPPVV